MTLHRVSVDRSLCSGFGVCAELAPHLLQLEGGIAAVRVGETEDPAALDAAAACPMGAITIEQVKVA